MSIEIKYIDDSSIKAGVFSPLNKYDKKFN